MKYYNSLLPCSWLELILTYILSIDSEIKRGITYNPLSLKVATLSTSFITCIVSNFFLLTIKYITDYKVM